MAEKFQHRETENILKALTEKQVFYKGTRTKKTLKDLINKVLLEDNTFRVGVQWDK